VVAGLLEDPYIQGQRIVLSISKDGCQFAEAVEVGDPNTLHLTNGASVVFRLQFVEEMPLH
jgi:hypothetical protein